MQNHNSHLHRIQDGGRRKRKAGNHVGQLPPEALQCAQNLHVVAARRVAEDDASAKWLPCSALLFANVVGFGLNENYAYCLLTRN